MIIVITIVIIVILVIIVIVWDRPARLRLEPPRPGSDASRQLQERGRLLLTENSAASKCSTGSSWSNCNKRISSKSSN